MSFDTAPSNFALLLKPNTLFILLAFTVLIAGCKKEAPRQEVPGTNEAPTDTTSENSGFDVLASDYYQNEARVIWQKPGLVLNLLGNLQGKTVADIGAGTGYFAFRVANAGGKVIAIDIDPRSLSYMDAEEQHYPLLVQQRFETRLANAHDPGLAIDEVDMVLMVNTYIYLDDRIAYFINLKKGLKENGKVVIIDFKKKSTPIGPAVEDRLSLQQVQQELISAGYTITSVDDQALDYQFVVTASLL